MCKPQEEGGKRCAAHTRPRYHALLAAMEANAGNSFMASNARNEARRKFEADNDENAVITAISHASTPAGAKEIAADIERFREDNDTKTVMFLSNALKKGAEKAVADEAATKAIQKVKAQIKAKTQGARGGGAGTGSVETLKPSRGTTEDNNCLAVYPDIGRYWKPEDNNGIGPEDCRPGSNGQLNWRCHECNELVSRHNYRVNSMTSGLSKGRYPICENCDPRRKARFAATQEELGSLADALGDDPDAFNALSPALQYSLMQKLGLLNGGADSMNRNIAMSIVHGDLTLKEVMVAQDFNKIDGRVRENLDDEDALATISDIDISDMETAETSTTVKVDQALGATGALSLIDPESELAANIRRESNEALWERATDPKTNLDEYVTYLNSQRGRTPQADETINRFTAELEAVRNRPLPDGYVTERVDRDGKPVTLDPTLAQRRFAAMVEDRRRVMNWSGTGAGKTLSTTLAVQGSGARETLVVCPLPVVEQWQSEFADGFPNNTEVRIGLPQPGETLPPLPEGVNRVWITNYDKFQGDADALHSAIGPLADRVDAVVFDEIHKAKSSDEATTSRRRKALEKFTDRAGRANPDLVVVGASATPVVNNLDEAQSVLRLVEGPESKKFNTKPTIKNAAAAYHRLAAAGIRHMPRYDSVLKRNDVTVDVSANLPNIQAEINRMRRDPGSPKPKRVNAAMMERALLPSKMPKIIEAVERNRANGDGPTLVYTEYTSGMVDPMRKEMEAKGLRVATYTGTTSEPDKVENLRKFRNGEVDVLIGSRPIATGVDGLQHASNNLVVASMAWTAADDDQLVGRLQRRGQQKNVNVDYILTEAKAGNSRWSWCKDNRQKRVHFKRDIANAAVDGILPEGALEKSDNGAEKALDALKDLTSIMAKAA